MKQKIANPDFDQSIGQNFLFKTFMFLQEDSFDFTFDRVPSHV